MEDMSNSQIVLAATAAAQKVQIDIGKQLGEMKDAFVKEIGDARKEFHCDLEKCRSDQAKLRRWGIASLIQSAGVIIALGMAFFSIWGG